MPSDKHNSITAEASGLIFYCSTSLQPDMCLLTYCIYIQYILHGLTSVFLCVLVIFADSESVDLVVAHDGFPSQWKLSIFLIVDTLIARVLFEQFLIRNTV